MITYRISFEPVAYEFGEVFSHSDLVSWLRDSILEPFTLVCEGRNSNKGRVLHSQLLKICERHVHWVELLEEIIMNKSILALVSMLLVNFPFNNAFPRKQSKASVNYGKLKDLLLIHDQNLSLHRSALFSSFNCWTVSKPQVTAFRGNCFSIWGKRVLRRSRGRNTLPHSLAASVFIAVCLNRPDFLQKS